MACRCVICEEFRRDPELTFLADLKPELRGSVKRHLTARAGRGVRLPQVLFMYELREIPRLLAFQVFMDGRVEAPCPDLNEWEPGMLAYVGDMLMRVQWIRFSDKQMGLFPVDGFTVKRMGLSPKETTDGAAGTGDQADAVGGVSDAGDQLPSDRG